MTEVELLKKTIAALEAQRAILGEDVVETALAPLQQKLAALQIREGPAQSLEERAHPEAEAQPGDRIDQEEYDQELAPSDPILDDLAGQVRGALDRRDLLRAHTHVEQILGYLAAHPDAIMDDPASVYLTCLRVLEAAGDPRAQALVEIAYAWLQEHAARILDEETRASFLWEVPANREIAAEWEKRTYQE